MMSGDNTADASVEDGDEVIPSSGRPIETTGVGTFIVKDGKITEAAYRWYPLGPLTQRRFFATGAVEIQLSDERVESAEMTDTPNPVILDPGKHIFQPLFQVSPALPESVDFDIKPIWIAFDVPPAAFPHWVCRTTTQEEIDAGERQSPRITIDH
jgi:hypothetical protein